MDPATGAGRPSPVRGTRSAAESGSDLAPASLFDLHGRVALVTGASSGLGEAFARGLAAAGARVVVVGRRRDMLADVAAGLPGGVPLACDLADERDIDRLVQELSGLTDRLDILVNNAGVPGPGVPAQRESMRDFDETMAVNVRAAYVLSKGAFPLLRAGGRAAVVNVTSISGTVGVGRLPQAAYVTSKHALTGLTRELALQWARYGIRVNALAPGFVLTELTAAIRDLPELESWVQDNTPLAGFARPEDLIGPLLLLASEAGRGITGQVMHVDNGWTAR